MKNSYCFFYIFVTLLFLTGCGGGGGSGSSGNLGSGSTALVDNNSIYDQDILDVKTLRVELQPGGKTLEDVESDTDPNDSYKPEVRIKLSENGYIFGNGEDYADGSLRIRGHTSRLADQKSYRIKLDSELYLWRGHRILHLNKHPWDLTRMRNKLSFDILKLIPDITSLRTQFIHLYIDEADYGLYTLVENQNESFLKNHGLDETGNLYKAENFEFYRYSDSLELKTDPEYEKNKFETRLEIKGDNKDHTKLLSMLDDVNNEDKDINEVISSHFNRENYLTWFAVNILMGNLDTNAQNFYLYKPSNSDIWYFLPWDYDGAWGFYDQPSQREDEKARWTQGISNWWPAVLHKKFLKDKNNLIDLLSKVEYLKNNYITFSTAAELVGKYKNLIYDTYLLKSPDYDFLPADTWITEAKAAEINNEIDKLPSTIEENYQMLMNTIERPMPVYMDDAHVLDTTIEFYWEESFDLQGDSITYDFQVSTTSSFDTGTIVHENLNLTGVYDVINMLPSGKYYYRVIIRDSKDPSENWQYSFETYKSFTIN